MRVLHLTPYDITNAVIGMNQMCMFVRTGILVTLAIHTSIPNDQKVSVHLTQCIRTTPTQLMSLRWPSQNTFGMWTVL